LRNLKVFSIEPHLERLESTFKIIEAKYRNIKKQQEVIADKIVEDGGSEEDQLLSDNQKVGASLKDNYLKVAKAYAAYQKKLSQPSPPTVNPYTLEAMTSAVTKMTEAMQGSKPMQEVLRSYQYHPGMVVVDHIQHGRKNLIIG
jgi:vesicle coat complex subunit